MPRECFGFAPPGKEFKLFCYDGKTSHVSCQFYSLDTTNINCKNKICSQKLLLLNNDNESQEEDEVGCGQPHICPNCFSKGFVCRDCWNGYAIKYGLDNLIKDADVVKVKTTSRVKKLSKKELSSQFLGATSSSDSEPEATAVVDSDDDAYSMLQDDHNNNNCSSSSSSDGNDYSVKKQKLINGNKLNKVKQSKIPVSDNTESNINLKSGNISLTYKFTANTNSLNLYLNDESNFFVQEGTYEDIV